MNVRSNFLWATMYKRFKSLKTILSELIVFLSAVPHYQGHHSLDVLAESMACLSTAEYDKNI